MRSELPQRADACIKRSILSGIVLALAAIIGVEAAMPAPFAGRRNAAEGTRFVVASHPAFELGGIVAVAGASVLVMAWLHRQSLRSPVLARRPITFRATRPQSGSHVELRAASISYQSGGLYGP